MVGVAGPSGADVVAWQAATGVAQCGRHDDQVVGLSDHGDEVRDQLHGREEIGQGSTERDAPPKREAPVDA